MLGGGRGKDEPMVHHPRYDFNDAILPIGASYWVTLAEQLLPRRRSDGKPAKKARFHTESTEEVHREPLRKIGIARSNIYDLCAPHVESQCSACEPLLAVLLADLPARHRPLASRRS